MVGSRIPQWNHTLGAASAVSSQDLIAIHVTELNGLISDEQKAHEEANEAQAALAYSRQLVAKLQDEIKRLRALLSRSP